MTDPVRGHLPGTIGDALRVAARHPGAPGAGWLPPGAPEDAWHLLVSAAVRHRIPGCLWIGVRDSPELPDGARSRLQGAHTDTIRTHLRVLSDLSRVSVALTGVDWAVVKGPVLAETVYRRPDLRAYVDLDVLVRPRHFDSAVGQLEEAGFVLLDQNWPLIRRLMVGELHLRSPSGAVVDLHWQLFNQQQTRDRWPLRVDDLLDRARPVVVGGRQVPTLSAPDSLVHVCLHAAAAGGDRLGWLKDIDQMVRNTSVSPEDLAASVRRSHGERAVGVMLTRAARELTTPCREHLAALRSDPGWRSLETLADRLDPVPRATGRRSLSLHVARSSVDGSRAWSRLLRSLTRESGRRLRRRAAPAAESVFTGVDGGASDRAAFMSQLSRY